MQNEAGRPEQMRRSGSTAWRLKTNPRWFGRVALSGVSFGALAVVCASLAACETVDPGPNFVVPNESFDADFFFCHVEPEVLTAKKCGSGEGSDRAGGCHFNPSSVSGMALADHPAVDCAGGDHPVSRAQLGSGGPASANLESASLVMSRDVQTAPILVRPLGANHPRAIFTAQDPAVDVLRRWSLK